MPTPIVEATNPTESAVLLIGMKTSIAPIVSLPRRKNMASAAATGQPTVITTACR